MEWLAQGRSPTTIAHELGYASASAFNYMFRMEMGMSPLQWRKVRQGAEPAMRP
ncbi:MAG: helix-turn-helix domain-containing protein [Stenotrophomonas chelatiphaga]